MFYEKLAGTVDTFRAASGIARPKGVPTLSATPKMPKPLTSKSNTPAVSTTINKNQVNSDVKNTTAVKTAARYRRVLQRITKPIHKFTDVNAPHTPGEEIIDTYKQFTELYSDIEKNKKRKNRGGAPMSKTLDKLKAASIPGKIGNILKEVGGLAKNTVKDIGENGVRLGSRRFNGETVRSAASTAGKAAVGTMAAYGGYKALTSDSRPKTAAANLRDSAEYKKYNEHMTKAHRAVLGGNVALASSLGLLGLAAKTNSNLPRKAALPLIIGGGIAGLPYSIYQYSQAQKMDPEGPNQSFTDYALGPTRGNPTKMQKTWLTESARKRFGSTKLAAEDVRDSAAYQKYKNRRLKGQYADLAALAGGLSGAGLLTLYTKTNKPSHLRGGLAGLGLSTLALPYLGYQNAKAKDMDPEGKKTSYLGYTSGPLRGKFTKMQQAWHSEPVATQLGLSKLAPEK